MPKDIHQRDTAQQRSSRLLLAMGIIVLLGALAYFVLTLAVNRRTPASPDTRYTAENGRGRACYLASRSGSVHYSAHHVGQADKEVCV